MKKRALFIIGFLFLFDAILRSQSANVPLQHWVYDFLDRLQTKGIIRDVISFSKPYSRHEVALMLAETVQKTKSGREELSSTEASLFEQLKGEFHEELQALNIPAKPRWVERHLMSWEEKDNRIKTDLHFDQTIDTKWGGQYERSERISQTTMGGMVRGRFQESFTRCSHHDFRKKCVQ
jgi:hypothetical protein